VEYSFIELFLLFRMSFSGGRMIENGVSLFWALAMTVANGGSCI
jgi:hypothetical protein